ncbi:DUF4383 domain-containing protein [Promicromonospora xylanilytica]
MTHVTATRRPRGAHQWLALVVGVVYLLVGIAGFFVTGFDMAGFMEHDPGATLLGFAINPLHNIVHLVIGILGIGAWSRSASARTFGWLLLIGYGAVFVYGLFAVNDPEINFLNINQADNWLHLGSALVGLLIAVWPAPARVVEQPGSTESMPPDVRDPRTGGTMPRDAYDQRTGGTVPPEARDPRTGGTVPPEAQDPRTGRTMPPEVRDPRTGEAGPPPR